MAELKPCLLLLFWVVAVVFTIAGTLATSDSYCFSFTWLGPKWNNESQGNGSCQHLNEKPEVCMDPLVITYDGTPPNMTWLWKKYKKTEIGCRHSENEACVKFTYYYNGGVENITYMCARVTVDSDYAMSSGCVTSYVGGHIKEVCACQPYSIADFPCNRAAALPPSLLLLALLLFSFLLVPIA
ncbi:uncharacterized protein LOC124162546 [Ischnura elegans]|uniref:uncharacterized protein LOC124162546 n=1 Tax=Ischnura elegans TaxID=197161 RepID=UPI001ED8719B|nr:uncharacterized protein LOC124162546 [Ischnura elegans]XP_046395082.1 uncharacterized protein LOC124162546 [Ischnura elegans]XP_046395083.1 uncharacterized protein LOC124162546 [Ischnura elegans]